LDGCRKGWRYLPEGVTPHPELLFEV
jgi:hypothetical protein